MFVVPKKSNTKVHEIFVVGYDADTLKMLITKFLTIHL